VKFNFLVHPLFAESANTPICGKRDDQCAKHARRAMEIKLYDEDLTSPLNVTKMWIYFSELRLFLMKSKTAQSFTNFHSSQTKLQLLASLFRDQLQDRALTEQADTDLPNQQTICEERHRLLYVIKTLT